MTESSAIERRPPPTSEGGWEDDDEPEEARAAEVDACGELSRTACMKSVDCTLVSAKPSDQRSGEYLCRRAEGPCEQGIVQFDLYGDAVAACTDRAGCAYQASDCYCACKGYGKTTVEDGAEAEACLCYCAGGAPPSCVAAG